MHLYKTVKNFLLDQTYFIDIYDTYIHAFAFHTITTLNEQTVELKFPDFLVTISGSDFRVLKLTKNEILITGTLKEVKFIR